MVCHRIDPLYYLGVNRWNQNIEKIYWPSDEESKVFKNISKYEPFHNILNWQNLLNCVYKKSFLATVQWTPWEIGIISWISLKRLLPQTIFLWVLCEKQSLGVNQNIAMKICLGLVWNNTNYMPIFHTAAISHSCGILIKNDVRHQNL